jgi:hypothetical protein
LADGIGEYVRGGYDCCGCAIFSLLLFKLAADAQLLPRAQNNFAPVSLNAPV